MQAKIDYLRELKDVRGGMRIGRGEFKGRRKAQSGVRGRQLPQMTSGFFFA